MANNIPTAKEFVNQYDWENSSLNIPEVLISFTKLHVKACKEEIADDYTYYLTGDEGSEILDSKKFNKEAYPLKNIK